MISGIIIVKNEQRMIEGCLKSLSFCDEIVIVDNGSTDETVKICQKFTDKIYEIKTVDFSKMRNFGKDKANGDWLLYIDADERISEELKTKILQANKKQNLVGFEIKRKNNFFGHWMKSGGWENEYLLRLMRKKDLKEWRGELHETAKVEGKIKRIEAPILHYSHQDLSECVTNTNVWSEIEANLRMKNNHPLMTTPRFIKLFIKELLTRVFGKTAWRDGVVGIIEAIYQSYSLLITYLKLWEKQNFENQNPNSNFK